MKGERSHAMGIRVALALLPVLERLAAAAGTTPSTYASRVLREHLLTKAREGS